MAINDSSTSLSQNYILMNDIDAEFETFIPIGNYINPFTGTFDGNGSTISNLTFIDSTADYVGLFGYIDGASISNLFLENVNFEGKKYIGGIAGYMNNSDISNSYATGNVKGSNVFMDGVTGGLVGHMNNSDISNSYATGNVEGFGWTGGLVGEMNDSNISNSYAMGNVKGMVSVGGLIGYMSYSNISDSYAMGDAEGLDNVGGFVGYVQFSSNISDSYSTGNAKGDIKFTGGFIGIMDNSNISNSYAMGNAEGNIAVGGFVGYMDSSNISNSYSMGDAEGDEGVGGFVGEFVCSMGSSNISNSYSTGNANGTSDVGGFAGFTVLGTIIKDSFYIGTANASGSLEGFQVTSNDLKQIGTFTILNPVGYVSEGWDISPTPDPNFIWYIDVGNDYPKLYWESTYVINFNSNGGTTVSSQRIEGGNTATKPTPDPTKIGYNFVEWQEVGSGTEYLFTTPVTSNLNLIAIYEIKTYTVSFDYADGTPIQTETIDHDDVVAKPTPDPTKTGYNFIGWQLNGVSYDFDEPVISNLNLIAIYEIKTYTVSFDYADGTPLQTETIDHDDVVARPSTDPAKAGYDFVEWQEVGSGTEYLFTTPVTSNLNLIAIYEIKTYTVTFEDDDGTPLQTETVDHNDVVARPSTDPSKAGYDFIGWQLNGVSYDFDESVTSNLNLIAIYIPVGSSTGGGSGTGSATIINNTSNAYTPQNNDQQNNSLQNNEQQGNDQQNNALQNNEQQSNEQQNNELQNNGQQNNTPQSNNSTEQGSSNSLIWWGLISALFISIIGGIAYVFYFKK